MNMAGLPIPIPKRVQDRLHSRDPRARNHHLLRDKEIMTCWAHDTAHVKYLDMEHQFLHVHLPGYLHDESLERVRELPQKKSYSESDYNGPSHNCVRGYHTIGYSTFSARAKRFVHFVFILGP
jgi:hypothetical protein